MIRLLRYFGQPVRMPVLTVAQTGITLPTWTAGNPPPMLILPGDLLFYFPIDGSTAGTFGVVSAYNFTNTTYGTSSTNLLYVAFPGTPLAASTCHFCGVAAEAFRMGETTDSTSILNYITVYTRGDFEMSIVSNPAIREVGAKVTVDGSGASTACKLTSQQVSFTSDTIASGGSAAVTSAFQVGTLVERAPVGATLVKVRITPVLI